jgi:hypothetical protein
MTKQLSPAAQHFYDSYWAEAPFEAEKLPSRLAAALRAAADQLDHATSAHTLYAIADELEAQ